MINLRYHIVSIVAVFLALGIGITMGSTFLNKAAVDQIDKNVRNAREEVRQVKAENEELRDQVATEAARSEEFFDDSLGRAFDGTLVDVPVVVIAADGVDKDSLDHLRVALTASGAAFDGTLTANKKLDVDEAGAGAVAEILGTEPETPAVTQRSLAEAVAGELMAAAEPPDEQPTDGPAGNGTTTTASSTPATTGPVTTVAGTGTLTVPTTTTTTQPERRDPPELLGALIEAGYLDYEPALGGATVDELLTARGYRYVMVTGPTADVRDVAFLRPLLHAMTLDASAPVVVASAAVGENAEEERGASLQPLIDDDQIGDRITTVDDLESLSGVWAVVLSIQDLEVDRHGHYGVGENTSSQLPGPRS